MGRRPPVRKSSFMKILVGDFSKKLLIPPKFVRLYRGTFPRKCKLRPSHTQDSWPVKTKQIDNFLYFSKGWRKFARHHSLESHDLLVFRYAQDSEFYVDMFDQSCCSKEPVTSQNVKSTRETSPVLPSKEKAVNPKTPAPNTAEKLMASSEFPAFKKVMRPVFVKPGGYLHLPLDFTKMHLEESRRQVKIEAPEKTWTIGLARDRCLRRLTKGWCKIVREKALKVGDVCVFQLTNTKDYTLKLTVFSSTT
ncbi:B3 domain-containing protein LOC_Os12g40080-like [Apium graveolens]|uniref:B3 domain-containing protein LOC_Os12g40080-like n=1 Tax=Apium graveolens TaxID=4045 RepID=UPI003D78E9C1